MLTTWPTSWLAKRVRAARAARYEETCPSWHAERTSINNDTTTSTHY